MTDNFRTFYLILFCSSIKRRRYIVFEIRPSSILRAPTSFHYHCCLLSLNKYSCCSHSAIRRSYLYDITMYTEFLVWYHCGQVVLNCVYCLYNLSYHIPIFRWKHLRLRHALYVVIFSLVDHQMLSQAFRCQWTGMTLWPKLWAERLLLKWLQWAASQMEIVGLWEETAKSRLVPS